MGFFETFWTWLNDQLTAYVSDNTARLAMALEPAVVTIATIYVMAWGYMQLTGKVEEPVLTGLRRIAMLALVLGGCLRLWLYNDVIVDTFYTAPSQLAAAMTHSPAPVATIDSIWNQGGAVASLLWSKGGLWGGDVGFYIAGTIVWLMMGLLCVYAMFLIALSSIALAVLLALGPLFIAALYFEPTRRLFQAWIAQLTTYALITILTVLVSVLLLHIVDSYAAQSLARGSALQTVDALDMLLVAFLVFLVLRQVMPIAASLGGGLALSSFGAISRGIGWSTRRGVETARPAAAFAATRAAGTLAYAADSTGRRVGAGVDAVVRHWRRMRGA